MGHIQPSLPDAAALERARGAGLAGGWRAARSSESTCRACREGTVSVPFAALRRALIGKHLPSLSRGDSLVGGREGAGFRSFRDAGTNGCQMLSAVGILCAQEGPAHAPSCTVIQEAGHAVLHTDFAFGDDFLAGLGGHVGGLL